MFDAENHYIDPKTGFARHKDTGHLIGLEQAPAPVANRDTEWPKWVVPHESHVVRPKGDGARTGMAVSPSNMEVDNGMVGIAPNQIATPGWQHSHVNRADGVVTVLVDNEDEERLATSEAGINDSGIEGEEIASGEASDKKPALD